MGKARRICNGILKIYSSKIIGQMQSTDTESEVELLHYISFGLVEKARL
jgi:hypothetical protein